MDASRSTLNHFIKKVHNNLLKKQKQKNKNKNKNKIQNTEKKHNNITILINFY